MGDASRPSMSFRIAPTNRDAAVSFNIHIPNRVTGAIPGKGNLLPLAAVMLRLKLEGMRGARLATVSVQQSSFADAPQLFDKAWNFLKNANRTDPTVLAAALLFHLFEWLSTKEKRRERIIEWDLTRAPHENLAFSVIDRGGNYHEHRTEEELMLLYDYLAGRATLDELFGGVANPLAVAGQFTFGKRPTGTTIVHRFQDGLPLECVRCSIDPAPTTLPSEIQNLIEQAHKVIRTDVPGIANVRDHDMLAPRRVGVEYIDLDGGLPHASITFGLSTYREYAAFAFAELLDNYSSDFALLSAFAKERNHTQQPAGATCSMGVRVLVETTDRKLLVAYRSNGVKLNPLVWSVSANEGVRPSLLKDSGDASHLLSAAVWQAMHNELRVGESECGAPMLLSIYHNRFNQWGAGFTVKTKLAAADVFARQRLARHGFEHAKMATLPMNIDQCGREMRVLGERWYGGALETICQFFAWQQLAAGRYVSPEDIALQLSAASGGIICPIDEANRVMIPERRTS